MKFFGKTSLSLAAIGVLATGVTAVSAETVIPTTELAAAPISQTQSEQATTETNVAESTVSAPQQLAQTTGDALRRELRIDPLTPDLVFGSGGQPTYSPSANPGVPSAFGANSGDVFIGVFGATGDKQRKEFDGSISIGTGVGDSRKYVGLEAVYNLTSIRKFASNGTFDLKLHRVVYAEGTNQIAAAVGWTNFANYGSEAGGTNSSVYGVVTGAHLLQPQDAANPQPLIWTLGAGGGVYRDIDNNKSGVGFLGSVGWIFHPQFSVSTGWSGTGLNLSASYLPDPKIPLNLSATYVDVANSSAAGSKLVLGVSYGFNFLPRF